jgi:predicted DNA-binding transcriptional regulator YafY
MRHEKTAALLDLARALAGSAEGLTLDEMARVAGVGRRTAERMRDALSVLFPQMEIETEGSVKRFRIVGGLDGLFQTPTAEELLELGNAVEALKGQGASKRARTLQTLEQKVRAAMRSNALRRVSPDLEALARAETTAVQAGPRAYEDETQISRIRLAVMSMRRIRFRYDGGSVPGRLREVTPYGVMFSRFGYLVGAETDPDDPSAARSATTWSRSAIPKAAAGTTARSRRAACCRSIRRRWCCTMRRKSSKA